MRGAAVCGRGPEGPWSAAAGADTGLRLMVGPWQYQYGYTGRGGWVVPTRYTPPRYPPTAPTPGTHLPDTARTTRDGTSTPPQTRVLDRTKEILGVNNALRIPAVSLGHRTPHLTLARLPPGPALGASCEAVTGLA